MTPKRKKPTVQIADLFNLLNEESDDFGYLIKKYRIDLSQDLVQCDLTNVNFGKLTTGLLNLTGSNLTGSDLSGVQCQKIVIEGSETNDTVFPTSLPKGVAPTIHRKQTIDIFKKAAIAIFRYQNTDYLIEEIINDIDDNARPILVSLDSNVTQDYVTKKIAGALESYIQQRFETHEIKYHTIPSLMREHESDESDVISTDVSVDMGELYDSLSLADFLLFYSRRYRPTKPGPSPADADLEFFTQLANSRDESIERFVIHDGVSLARSKKHYQQQKFAAALQSSVDATKKSGLTTASSADVLRDKFIDLLSRETGGRSLMVVVFSGFPPISRELFQLIRPRRGLRIKMVFIVTEALGSRFLPSETRDRNRLLPIRKVFHSDLCSSQDVWKISSRITVATDARISMSAPTARILRSGERRLTEVKQLLAKKLLALAESAVNEDGGDSKMHYEL